jgi:hypothetical protein
VSVKPAAVADRRKSVAVTPSGSVLSVPSVLDVVSGVPEVAVAVPSAAAVVADPARVPARAQRGAATRATMAPVFVGDVVTNIRFTVVDFMDSFGIWLSSFPSNAITDFLAGGLWLVRRTLIPVGSGVGLWGSAACVSTGDCSDVDLTGADLEDVDLSGVDLAGVTLVSADLSGASLGGSGAAGANFSFADLSGAQLQYADFIGAQMRGVKLNGANLYRAKLMSADLTMAQLIGANLEYADVTNAKFTLADLTGANIFATRGLTAARWFSTTCPDGSKSNKACEWRPDSPN